MNLHLLTVLFPIVPVVVSDEFEAVAAVVDCELLTPAVESTT